MALLAFFGTTTPNYVVKIPAAQMLAKYKPEQIEWAKDCAAQNGIRYRIVWKKGRRR